MKPIRRFVGANGETRALYLSADYWGEPFAQPEWRRGLSDSEDVWPHADELTED